MTRETNARSDAVAPTPPPISSSGGPANQTSSRSCHRLFQLPSSARSLRSCPAFELSFFVHIGTVTQVGVNQRSVQRVTFTAE